MNHYLGIVREVAQRRNLTSIIERTSTPPQGMRALGTSGAKHAGV
jgi:hypothetical protein